MAGGHRGGNEGRWLVSYADMITLLMVFFVVLYAMSEIDKKKFGAVATGLNNAFNGGGHQSIISGGAPAGGKAGQELPPPPTTGGKSNDPLLKLAHDLAVDFQFDGRFTVWTSDRGITISLAGSAAFDSGEATIRQEFVPLLNEITDRLAPLPYDISLEGFTDSDPIQTAAYPSNWELAVARSNQVRAYFESRGIMSERMIVLGYAATRSVFPNDSAENKAKNRRVDVVVLREKQTVERGQQVKPTP